MINEKELRIGNLYTTTRNSEIMVRGIDTENKYVVINPLDAEMEVNLKSPNSIIYEDLHPIELTEQTVLRLGFVRSTSIYMKVSSDKGAQFEWDEKTNQIVLIDCDKGMIGQSIKYVHQFQNIYYFLTGKELLSV
ncbi:MAG: hypothetical protein WKF97_00170 [Chitinophagaceae bacterium]